MNGRRAIVGLCMLCALLVSAFAAQSASAVTNGTTAFTCTTDAPKLDRRGEHCLEGGTPLAYGHKEIAQDKTTEIVGTNAKTASETTAAAVGRLKVTIAGVPLELSAEGVSGSGWMENKLTAGGEHYAHGKGTITFTKVKVTQPAGRGCKATTHKEDGSGAEEGENEVVHTKELTATTEGQGMELKFQPAVGNVFANFFVTCEEGKKIPAIEGTWQVTGSIKGTPNGATTGFTHAGTTGQGTLFARGVKAGIEGQLTLEGRDPAVGGTYNPLAATTVETK